MADNTILDYPDELLRLSLSFLGLGHFVFLAGVCSRFKIAYLANATDETITSSGENVTSSISCDERMQVLILNSLNSYGTMLEDMAV